VEAAAGTGINYFYQGERVMSNYEFPENLYLCTGRHNHPETLTHSYVFSKWGMAMEFCRTAREDEKFADITWHISVVYVMPIDTAIKHMEVTVEACAEADAMCGAMKLEAENE
jgi:hypothetical protein